MSGSLDRPGVAVRDGQPTQWAGALLLSLCGLLAVGCALRDGGEVLDIDIDGSPVDAATLPFIPGVLKSSWLMQDAAGDPWLAVSIPDDILTPTTGERSLTNVDGPLHMYQLSPPYDHYRLDVDSTILPRAPAQSLCSYRLDKEGSWWLSLLQPGSRESTRFEAGPIQPRILCGQRSLAYWQDGSDNLFVYVLRRRPDGSVVRLDLPWPREANPKGQQGPLSFDDREGALFVIDGNYHRQVYYLDTGEIVDLGAMDWSAGADRYYIGIDFDGALIVYNLDTRRQQPIGYRVSPAGTLLGIDVEHREIITCDWDGVRAVALPTDGQPSPVVAPQRVLDASPCQNRLTRTLPRVSGVLRYIPDNTYNIAALGYEERAVPLDGSLPPRIMARIPPDTGTDDGEGESSEMMSPPELKIRLLQICQNRATVTTTTPAGMYGLGVSDGWLNGQRFMERGRDVLFSADCGTLYFKEHTANVRKLGTLHSLPVPADPSDSTPLPTPLRLSFNVGVIRLLADGRLLASTDLAVLGSQNRLIAIDVAARRGRALAWGVNAVTNAWPLGFYYPGRSEVLVEVKDGSTGGLHGMFLLDAGSAK